MTITNDNLTGVTPATQQRARWAADECVERVADAIGEQLSRRFPEARTGDERPDVAGRLDEAVRAYVGAWVQDNVPATLTLAEAVAALVEARNALASFQADTRWTTEDAGALAAVQAALNRSGMSDDDLPRP